MSVLKKEGFFLPGFKRYIIILFSRLVILVDILPSHLTKRTGFFLRLKMLLLKLLNNGLFLVIRLLITYLTCCTYAHEEQFNSIKFIHSYHEIGT